MSPKGRASVNWIGWDYCSITSQHGNIIAEEQDFEPQAREI
jgi:hypothetical protein